MEPTFYEDQHPQQRRSKRRSNLTLDLTGLQTKKFKSTQGSGVTPLLDSQDLLKINSPDFEKLMMSQQMCTLPTPTTTQMYLKGTAATEAQEEFTKGFETASSELHHSEDSSQGENSTSYINLDQPPFSVQSCNTDSQIVPEAMSPLDMDRQEKIKLERKRQRNRVAASKCRKRKLEKISRLEDKVRLLKGENGDLNLIINRLKEHVCRLKEQVMNHVHLGCRIMPDVPH